MDITEFLSAGDAIAGVRTPDKTRLLSDLASRLEAKLKLGDDLILREILKREALGSTGMGYGIAIPHARIQSLRKPIGIMAQLRSPIAFDSIDSEPVDLVFLLLLPADCGSDSLTALACVARKFRERERLSALRSARDGASLYHAMAA